MFLAQPETAIAHDIAQSNRNFRADCVIADSKKLSAQGARAAVAMLMFPNSIRVKVGRLSRGADRNANVARLAFRPGVMIMDGKIELHFNIYDESNVNRLRANGFFRFRGKDAG